MLKNNITFLHEEDSPEKILDEVVDRFNEGEIRAMAITIYTKEEKAHSYWYGGAFFVTLLGCVQSLTWNMMNWVTSNFRDENE